MVTDIIVLCPGRPEQYFSPRPDRLRSLMCLCIKHQTTKTPSPRTALACAA
jgi:hypothetical protein